MAPQRENALQAALDILRRPRRPVPEPRWTVRPIEAAPQEPERTLLLYCPDQAGWTTGVWFDGRWVSNTGEDELFELTPNYWTDVPPDPDGL